MARRVDSLSTATDTLAPTLPRLPAVQPVFPSPSGGGASGSALRPVIIQAVAMWAGTRLMFLVISFIALTLVQNKPISGTGLLNLWSQWDTGHYLAIAQQGYFQPEETAFFPLFPLLTAALGFIVGSSHLLFAALVVSNLAALVAFIGIALLATHEFGTEDAGWRALRVAAAYPLAFFLFAPYTESLFLAFAVFALYFARRSRWLLAALCAFGAGLTRSTAVILILPLFWEFGRQQGWWQAATWRTGAWKKSLVPATLGRLVLAVGAVPAAVATYALYLWATFNDPLIFTKVQATFWHRQNAPLWQTLAALFDQLLHPHTVVNGVVAKAGSYWRGLQLVDIGLLAAFIIITLVMARRTPFAYTLYMLGLALLTLSVPNPDRPEVIQSTARFLTVAFPIFLIISQRTKGRPWLNTLVVDAGFALLGIFTIIFLAGGWIE